MRSSFFTAVVLAGAATAVTPPSFEPASNNDLFVSFGNTLAVNGVDLPKDVTQSAPTVGTTQRLSGTYALMMVDPDIPPATAGGPTTELLHWMQTNLVSANTSTNINGQAVFELTNPTNTRAAASYIGPSPPNRSPVSHRYTQLLLDMSAVSSGNNTAMRTLMAAAMSRANFSAVNVVRSVGASVVAGNSFNVTANAATSGIGGGNQTIPGAAAASGTGSGTLAPSSTSTIKPNEGAPAGSASFTAAFVAFVVAVLVL